jgi:hypothetical protein
MKRRAFLIIALLLSVLGQRSQTASAVVETLSFYNLTGTNAINVAAGEDQLFVDVSDSAGQVIFTFRNIGPVPSSISEIYFDDGSLLAISEILDSPPEVDFKLDADPSNLPGHELADPAFQASLCFSLQPENPEPYHGVNPGEQLSIVFDLINEQTFTDVIDELNTGELRIGIHVIAFENGGSESFVNTPEPASIFFLSLGIVAIVRRRKK